MKLVRRLSQIDIIISTLPIKIGHRVRFVYESPRYGIGVVIGIYFRDDMLRYLVKFANRGSYSHMGYLSPEDMHYFRGSVSDKEDSLWVSPTAIKFMEENYEI